MDVKPTETHTYRQRIYKQYNSARQQSIAPINLEGLKNREPYFCKLIREHFPPEKSGTILDLGCGYGALIYFARQAGYTNITGIDTSAEQVEAAKRLGIEGVQEGELLSALEIRSAESVETIIAFDLIEHFTKTELITLTDKVYRVLRPNGTYIVHTVNGESPFANAIRYGDFSHELAFTRTSVSQLLLSSGFREVKCFEDTPIRHGIISFLRWLLWKIIRGFLRFYVAVETGDISSQHIFTQNFLTIAKK